MRPNRTNHTKRYILIALAIVALGFYVEATRPDCSEFNNSDRSYWSQTDYEIYANCK